MDYGGNEHIISLVEDSAGIIWAGTTKGLYRYIRAEEKFVLFQDTIVVGKQKQIRQPVQMVCDALGDIWIASATCIAVLKPGVDKAVDAALLFKGLARANAHRITLDQHGDLWLAASGE